MHMIKYHHFYLMVKSNINMIVISHLGFELCVLNNVCSFLKMVLEILVYIQ